MTKQSDKNPAPPPLPPRSAISVAHSGEEISHRLHWERLLDAGLIENRNPPMTAANRAIAEANDRLFRQRRARQRGGGRGEER